MSTKPEQDHHEDGAQVIDTTGMSKGKREALELTEASRESHWTYPTFAGALFMGELPWDLVYPFPQLPEDEWARPLGRLRSLRPVNCGSSEARAVEP